MPTFTYRAKEPGGRAVSGSLEALSQGEAMRSLIDSGLMVTSIRDESASPRQGFAPMRLGNIGVARLALFTRQFAAMLRAGLDVTHVLETLEQQIPDRRLQRVAADVGRRVGRGESLAKAMSRHPGAFNLSYVTMVEVGEEAGRLDTVLSQVADWLEAEAKLQRYIRGQMLYPVLIIAFAFLTVLVFFPLIQAILGGPRWLPPFVADVAWLALIVLIVGFILFQFANVKKVFVEFLKRMPVFGPVMMRVTLRRLALTLATMLEAGVPLLKSLDTCRRTIGDWRMEIALRSIYRRVSRDGMGLAAAMRATHGFPPDFLSMMNVGEEAGSPESMLFKIAEYYDSMIRSSTHGIIAVVRVTVILLIAIFVGFIVISFWANYVGNIVGWVETH